MNRGFRGFSQFYNVFEYKIQGFQEKNLEKCQTIKSMTILHSSFVVNYYIVNYIAVLSKFDEDRSTD